MPEVVNVTLKRSDAKLPDTQVSNTDAIRPLEKADHITLRTCIDRDEAADVQVSEEHKYTTDNSQKRKNQCDTDQVTDEAKSKKKRKRSTILEPIDLSDVPPQTPILKNNMPQEYVDNSRQRPVIEGKSSNYLGVHWDTQMKKWRSQMMIKGVVRFLGYFDTEVNAAAVYAKAAYKYKPKKGTHNLFGGLDLSGISQQQLIPNQRVASGYKGVKQNKKRWEARISGRTLGTFDTPEDAADIYARAVKALANGREFQK